MCACEPSRGYVCRTCRDLEEADRLEGYGFYPPERRPGDPYIELDTEPVERDLG